VKIKKEIEDLLENLVLKYVDSTYFYINQEINPSYVWNIYIDVYLLTELSYGFLQMIYVGKIY